MILNEGNLSTQYSLKDELDRAYEEGTLEEFICDYVGWIGTIEDIKAAQQESSIIEESDIERALKNLYQKDMLKQDEDPYKILCDAFVENYRDFDDEKVLEHVRTSVYWPHIGSKRWEDAYDKFEEEFKKDPLEYYHALVKEHKEGVNHLMEDYIFEGLNPTRLTTAGDLLKTFEDGDANKYKREQTKMQTAAKLLRVSDFNAVLIYKVGDAGLFNWFDTKIRNNKNAFVRAFKAAFGKGAKSIGIQTVTLYQEDGVTDSGRIYPELGFIAEKDEKRLYIKDRSTFDNLSELLDSKSVDGSGETDIEVADASPSSAKVLAKKEIHCYKTKTGQYYAKIEQVAAFEDKRFDTEKEMKSTAAEELKKAGYNVKEFKLVSHYSEDSSGKNVERDEAGNVKKMKFNIGGTEETYDVGDVAFILDGKVLNYDGYNKLSDKDKKRVICVKRDGLLNKTLGESFNTCPDVCVEDVLLIVPEHIKIETRGPEYYIQNCEDEYRTEQGCYIDGDLADKIDFIYNCFVASGGCGEKEEFVNELEEAFIENAPIDAEVKTVAEIIEGLHGNVDDKTLDKEIRFFKRIGALLGTKDYDNVYVVVDEGEHDPEYIFGDGMEVETADKRLVKMYPSAKCVVEQNSGLLFIYFATEMAALKFLQAADMFLTDIELENYYKPTEKENEEVIDIKESLNNFDATNNNKYDLLNMYLSEKWTKKQVGTICSMIKENCTPEQMYNYLNEKQDTKTRLKSKDSLLESNNNIFD